MGTTYSGTQGYSRGYYKGTTRVLRGTQGVLRGTQGALHGYKGTTGELKWALQEVLQDYSRCTKGGTQEYSGVLRGYFRGT